MSTQGLETSITASRAVLANVTTEQLDGPTPCESWDVRSLINHIVGAHHWFASMAAGEPMDTAEIDFGSGDYLAAFDDSTAKSVAAFSSDGVLEKTITLPFGEFPGSAFMGLATTDTFQHAWDLAKATGQNTDLAPDFAASLLAGAKRSIPAAFRGADGQSPFGAEVPAPEGACNADQLAAFLGRTP